MEDFGGDLPLFEQKSSGRVGVSLERGGGFLGFFGVFGFLENAKIGFLGFFGGFSWVEDKENTLASYKECK